MLNLSIPRRSKTIYNNCSLILSRSCPFKYILLTAPSLLYKIDIKEDKTN